MVPPKVSVTCPRCKLIQFLTASKLCRKCDEPIGVRCIEISLPPRDILFDTSNDQRLRKFIGALLLKLRRLSGCNQTQFSSALATGHRTGLSRIECGHLFPSLPLFLRAISVLEIDGIYLRIRNPER